jgi:hypothetical protein
VKCIKYREGYKYQLAEDYSDNILLAPPEDIRTEWIDLDAEGNLLIRKGYAWDGASGPTFDTKDSMRGSLIHDALYQLFRLGHLDPLELRDDADLIFRLVCLEDGMWKPRAYLWYQAVRIGADDAAEPGTDRPILCAPCECE